MNKLILTLTALLLPLIPATAQQVLEKDDAGYLFVYFTGNGPGEEAIHYAVSTDGLTFRALNNDRPVLDSKVISSTGGVRDPHILRGEDGHTFYMVATDMVAAKGWDSNRAMVLMRSTDLIHWTSRVVNIQSEYSGQESLKRVWAPQTIYDAQAKKYMIYWSMKHGDGPDIIYRAYANKAFTDLEDAPQPLFQPEDGKSCIDGDILYAHGLYHLFYKTEGHGNGIRVATSESLTSGKWTEQPDYKQQTRDAVEGAGTFKLIGQDKYILMYDVYTKGRYEFTETSDLEHFKAINGEVSMNFHPRHGTIMAITRDELLRLCDHYGTPAGITPPVNPVIAGYYADPEVLYSYATKRYYIYPTTDGQMSADGNPWAGYYFKAFSSTDLRYWRDEGIILDLRRDLKWADTGAWAPCIIEKKTPRGYRYYYYFVGKGKIGVATSSSPTGPFRDSGRPLLDHHPDGVKHGQEIDPDVFQDPRTGKCYLYWGNGYLAVAELSADMQSLRPGTTHILTPPHYNEGAYVFYRKGLYYFIWSQNDTRDPNYQVHYAYSHSPIGPLTIPENNCILSRADSLGIYGTGHCSVLQLPGRDEWRMVYHRFNLLNGAKGDDAAGSHREVCIDRLQFRPDGTILPVKVTR